VRIRALEAPHGGREPDARSAALREHGAEITLAGTSVLTFDDNCLVIEQRDAWNQADRRREPPQGWGR